MNLKTIATRLESSDREGIGAILNRKAEDVGATGTADYIAMAIDNIDAGVSRIDSAIKELQNIKKDMKCQQEIVKTGAAEWLESNGVDKLQGDLVSSVTVSKKKETVELIITDEESCINAGFLKVSIDKTSLKNALLSGMEVEGAKLETTHNEDTIRVNKRKKNEQDN